jgi:hypothetical protein
MWTAAFVSLLIGLALAQRFKVLSLIPVIFLTLLFALTAELSGANRAWTSALTATVAIAGLQVGYLLGIGLRQLTLIARAARRLHTTSRVLPSQGRAP